MEEEDEIQSNPSPATGSPTSPNQNGRITVTVAAAPPPPSLTLALPIQPKSANNSGSGGGGREDCWSEGATSVLIDAWGERYLELSRGNLKQKHWREVADVVSSRDNYLKTPKTDIQCKNRIDTVKKKYKQEKAKMAAGGGPSKWQFFHRLDHLIGPIAKMASPLPLPSQVPTGIPVAPRSFHQYSHRQNLQKYNQENQEMKQKMQFRRRVPGDSEEEDSGDSLPPEKVKRTRRQRELTSHQIPAAIKSGRNGRGGEGWGDSMRELTKAILKFGEAYEQAETSKLQQVVEMEKQRMKFAKDLELQRMQFFMKTQLEISQLKHSGSGRRVGSSNNHQISSNNNNNDNNSDSSNRI